MFDPQSLVISEFGSQSTSSFVEHDIIMSCQPSPVAERKSTSTA